MPAGGGLLAHPADLYPSLRHAGLRSGLHLANLLVQFDRREGWLPNAILMPMLLCGLLAGAALGYAAAPLGGPVQAGCWGVLACLACPLPGGVILCPRPMCCCLAHAGHGSGWAGSGLFCYLQGLGSGPCAECGAARAPHGAGSSLLRRAACVALPHSLALRRGATNGIFAPQQPRPAPLGAVSAGRLTRRGRTTPHAINPSHTGRGKHWQIRVWQPP